MTNDKEECSTTDDNNPPKTKSNKDDAESPHTTLSPKGMLLEYIHELAIEAVASGSAKISPRPLRTLQRLITTCVDVAAKELLHALIEKYVIEQDNVDEEKKQSALVSPPPDQVSSVAAADDIDGVVVNPLVLFDTDTMQSPASCALNPPIIGTVDDPVVLEFDDDDDQSIDDFEAMIKQSDSTKRAMDTAERQENQKKAKIEKRETFIALAQP